MKKDERIEHFSALDAVGVCRSALIKRIPGIDVVHHKAEALRRLDSTHREIRASLGMDGWPMVTAEQIHASAIAVIDQAPTRDQELPGCDGLITDQRGIVLGIHVADCCAIFIVDPVRLAIALLHSGRKGTELEIVVKGIDQMREKFSSNPSDLVIQLSPCVRPPHYETDFAAKIIDQCRARGVRHLHDSGICTACDLDAYYSYRAEKGKTGRMLGLLALV